jgi:hypothetical protein
MVNMRSNVGYGAYSRTPLILINWDGEPPGYAKKSGKLEFFMKIGYIGNLKWVKILQMTI